MNNEWTSQFNSFNSLKTLCWKDRFESIMKGEIPKPVSVTVDGTNTCNLACPFCHYASFRKKENKTVSEEDLLWVADAVKKLGAESICYSGGGEPLLHHSVDKFFKKAYNNDIHLGMITNGTLIHKYIHSINRYLRWVGISVDSSTPETYKKMKGANKDLFNQTLLNIRLLSMIRGKSNHPSIGFKFLIHPDNYKEIYQAARLAKITGADDFHARPCYNPGMKWPNDAVDISLNLISKARMDLEDDNFHIYGVTHKFNPNFSKKSMDKCEVTPIAGLTFAADGWCYVCCDLRGVSMGKLCKWRDILDVWGSDKHKEVLRKINPDKCPHRCTYVPYQEILDNVFRKDKMTYRFP